MPSSGGRSRLVAAAQCILLLILLNLFSITTLRQWSPLQTYEKNADALPREIILQEFLIDNPNCQYKTMLLRQYQAIGINLTRELCDALPKWSKVVRRLGDRPYILGQETCARYCQRTVERGGLPTIRIAGLPNAAMDMMIELLHWTSQASSDLNSSNDLLVPWGVHTPLSAARRSRQFDDSIFTLVLVQDPLQFMNSLCKNPDTLQWNRGKHGRCPNLVPTLEERQSKRETNFGVKLPMTLDNNRTAWRHYQSIADYWASWIEEWVTADVPRLIVRSEDLYIFPEQVAQILTDCICTNSSLRQTPARVVESLLNIQKLKQFTLAKLDNSALNSAELIHLQTTLKSSIMNVLHYDGVADGSFLLKYKSTSQRSSLHSRRYSRWEAKSQQVDGNHLIEDEFISKCENVTVFLSQNLRCDNKVSMIQELASAGVCPVPEFCEVLPSRQQVVSLYGDKPVVLGLETCHAYRRLIGNEPPMPKLTALWNSGSTALSTLFLNNMLLYDKKWKVDRATVPWGKHTPLYLKHRNTFPAKNPDNRDKILPVVLVRDPMRWMASMCRSSYGAKWRMVGQRCPNLIPTDAERQVLGWSDDVRTFAVDHSNLQARFRYHTPYDSLADMWSTWYGDYLEAKFPRLFVRMEDMIFFPKQVMKIIGDCSGMPIRERFHYVKEQGKDKSSTDLVTAMIKYGTKDGRIPTNLTREEREYLRTALDPKLMQLLHYPQIPVGPNDDKVSLLP
ncbi:hypothetical protein MPSEU_000577300 [Mayamaea pseudoterrestris]|nr:hypothetical protein MPSEU_000577300 [Mayamaea pseudoterrestris]